VKAKNHPRTNHCRYYEPVICFYRLLLFLPYDESQCNSNYVQYGQADCSGKHMAGRRPRPLIDRHLAQKEIETKARNVVI
jgi:hypothetical protein